MPGSSELLIIIFIVVVVFAAHNLSRVGDALGRVLERLFGGSR